MSKRAVVEGEVKIRDGKDTEIEFFEEEFFLDDSVTTLEQARSIIQNGLIDERLKKRNGYKGWRTCQVISFEASKQDAENGDLDMLILKATELNCIPENIGAYKRPDYKIKALQRAIETAQERLAKKKPVQEDELLD